MSNCGNFFSKIWIKINRKFKTKYFYLFFNQNFAKKKPKNILNKWKLKKTLVGIWNRYDGKGWSNLKFKNPPCLLDLIYRTKVKGMKNSVTILSLSLSMNFVNFVIVFFAYIILGKIARLVKDMLKFWNLVQWQGLIKLQPFTPSYLLDIIYSTKVKGTRSGATIHSLSLNVYVNFVNFITDFFASIIIKKIARWVKDMVIGMLKLTISMNLN